jgi:hypothetical protein
MIGGSTRPGVGRRLTAHARTNTGTLSPPHRYTPSSTRQCRWMFRLAAEPWHWTSATAPPWPSSHLPVPNASKAEL